MTVSKLRRTFYLMIVVLGIAAYARTLTVGFLWDDHVTIEMNPSLRSWSLSKLHHDFVSDAFDHQGNAYYRPMSALTARLDYTLWGLKPFGYHLTNLLVHLGNSL